MFLINGWIFMVAIGALYHHGIVSFHWGYWVSCLVVLAAECLFGARNIEINKD